MFSARIVACCLLLAALSACAANRGSPDGNAGELNLEDLAGRTYYLVSMDGKNFAGANAPELSFTEAGRVTGRACNRFSGTVNIVNGTLSAKNAALTRMACPQPFLNELEQTLSDMLQHGTRARLDSRQLILARDGHTLVYALSSPKP
ncbi:MAG: META domain-containing protein [Deltaproteobacteria bacterium]|jgi:heat shock protein HslJ|nr:META domain-containing protein [Deltaproteobacteria bacterium]